MLRYQRRIVLDTLIPSHAHPVLKKGIFEAGWDAFEQRFWRDAVFSMRLGYWAALFTAIWIAPLLIGRLPPISLYRRETRERALLALYRSRIYALRQMFLLLKATVCFCYGADRDVRDAIGFPRQHDDPRYALREAA